MGGVHVLNYLKGSNIYFKFGFVSLSLLLSCFKLVFLLGFSILNLCFLFPSEVLEALF